MNGEYRRLRELSDIAGDANSCSVISFAAAMDLDYVKAFKLLEAAGRKKGKGVYDKNIFGALVKSGFSFESTTGKQHVKDYKYANILTYNNATNVLDKNKVYLLMSNSHMAAMKGGEVIDWAAGRKIRVDEVIEIKINKTTTEK